MKTAIIVHGWPSKEEYFKTKGPSPSNRHWLPWVQHQLIIKGVLAQTPEMPDAYLPVYEKWKSVFERFDVDEDTILIGHSCGGGFLVRWLSENKVRVGKVVLVAPWLDPVKELDTGIFDFIIDSDIAGRTAGLTIMYSTDDEKTILETINLLKEKTKGITFKEFNNKGHFCYSDMKTDQFPELMELLYIG
ncbi:MAG: alpha/beta hydrolase [Candidatus Paceibacterota bacterium]|jgi:hypothetical protein